ncbi:hypothetical protein Skr01_24270 [Sphaerisporangium krabiense]|uniref:Putative repeat protein (TIGR01451 family) n=1 Tax=Sphaerisporangium krabiense TaxID=763782 RepID=A0A7W8Z6C0_9ACTN|nr:DUF11 domain-containing protein [Sphaerisporangium krabiense]MBB5628172.1 putative repeat protein (TIGR01451 family) [Sphaerisporangium krabiense]GII62342.1 hypothetical protein Skr01_24270 [Sphaerisporangium krabiense]
MFFHVTPVRPAAARGARAARPLRAVVLSPLAAALAAVPVAAAVVPAHASVPHPAEPAYALRIGIDNGQTSVRPGDRLTYTIQVSNTGAKDSPDLVLKQVVPPGLKVLSSTPEGKISRDVIAWRRAVPAGRTDRLSVAVEVGSFPAQLRRLAAVVCASVKHEKRPIVCATDLDRLPSAAPPSERASVGAGLWWALGAVLAVLVAFLGPRARRALRRARP